MTDLKEGNEFLNFDETTLDRWYIAVKNILLNNRYSETTKGHILLTQGAFEYLHRSIGTSVENKYYRYAKVLAEEIKLIFIEEGVFNIDPSWSKVGDYLGSSTTLSLFYNNLKGRGSPHMPGTVDSLLNSIESTLVHDNRYNQDDVKRILDKVEFAAKPYQEALEDYWKAEDVMFPRGRGGQVFSLAQGGSKRELVSAILHSHEVLEQITSQNILSRLLFASNDYLTSHFLVKGEVELRPQPDRLERMRFLVSMWDSELFESLGLKATAIQIESAKAQVLEVIKKWIFSNPQADHESNQWKPYINTQIEDKLDAQYYLSSAMLTAAASRLYKDFQWSEKSTLPYSMGNIRKELGISDSLLRRLEDGDPLIQKDLENAFSKIAGWHREDFGDRFSGLDYNRLDKHARYQIYHYQNALYKITKYAEKKGITLFDGKHSTGLVKIGNTERKISDIIKKDYDNNFNREGYKEFHLLFQLSKYIGFDPLTFTPLKDSDMATGRSQLHHFLAEMFRKMSSNVIDIVLTSITLHRKYETILRAKGSNGEIYGKALEGEEYIRALMKTIQDLIKLDVPKIMDSHIRETLISNLGNEEGLKIYQKWIGTNKDDHEKFLENLELFNDRRNFAHDGRYEELLIRDYLDTWNQKSPNAKLYIPKLKDKLPIFFSYQPDLDILNEIFTTALHLP